MNNQTCGILCQVSEQWISPHWSSPPLGVLQSTEWGPSRNSSAAEQPGTQSLSFSVYPVRNDRYPGLSCIKRGTLCTLSSITLLHLYHKAWLGFIRNLNICGVIVHRSKNLLVIDQWIKWCEQLNIHIYVF